MSSSEAAQSKLQLVRWPVPQLAKGWVEITTGRSVIYVGSQGSTEERLKRGEPRNGVCEASAVKVSRIVRFVYKAVEFEKMFVLMGGLQS